MTPLPQVNDSSRAGVIRVMTVSRTGWLRYALLVAACLGVAVPVSAQGFKWWSDEGTQKRLSLSADQSRKIEDIFQQALPALRTGKQRFDAAEQELSALIEHSADDGPVVRQLERVEAARSELNKSRTLMLLQMRRLLSPDQRVRLDELHHERGRDLRNPPGRPSNRP